MTPDTSIMRSPKATFQVVEGEAILMHLDTSAYFSLNKVGTEFWEMLDGERTVGELALQIAQKYGVQSTMVVNDMIELSGKMLAEDLVHVTWRA